MKLKKATDKIKNSTKKLIQVARVGIARKTFFIGGSSNIN